MPMEHDFASAEFDEAVRAGTHSAFLETLAAGLPVFYSKDGLELMQQPDGRLFEIRWLPGRPSGANYEVVRELAGRAT